MWVVLLIAIVAVIGLAWVNRRNRDRGEAKLGPDGTNVDPPETFVVHHEGKGQGIDIANTALKERTEKVRGDLPGTADEIRDVKIPGRTVVKMDSPPSDVSAYGDEKVAPGQAGSGGEKVAPGELEPGESKEKILREGPIGSRPGTPEEPGSPYQKGRRVSDIQRSIEAAAELLPDVYPSGRRPHGARNVAGPDEFGLGTTASEKGADAKATPVTGRGQVTHAEAEETPATEVEEIIFTAEDDLAEWEFHFEAAREWEGRDWSALREEGLSQLMHQHAVVALVKDPRSMYVFWRLADREPGEPGRRVLRVWDVTGQLRLAQEHLISPDLDHWWVNNLTPGQTYYAEVGHISVEGRYVSLGRSGEVQTPAAHQAQAEHLPTSPGQWHQ